MKTKKIETMDKKDEQLCVILQQFGYSANVAKIILYFMHNKKGISKHIEQTINLRQPEVSVGIRELRAMNMVDAVPLREKNKGKGRPIYEYSMQVTTKELIKKIREKATQKIEQIQGSLVMMDNLVSGMKFKGE